MRRLWNSRIFQATLKSLATVVAYNQCLVVAPCDDCEWQGAYILKPAYL